MFDPYATADAIKLLDLKRAEAAPLPNTVWQLLHNASRHLDNQLRDYFRGDRSHVEATPGARL